MPHSKLRRLLVWIILSLIICSFIRPFVDLPLTGYTKSIVQHYTNTSTRVNDSFSLRSGSFIQVPIPGNTFDSSVQPMNNETTIKSDTSEEEDKITNLDFGNKSILTISDLLSGQRGQFQKAPVNHEFLSDLARFHEELTANYAPSSSCRRVTHRFVKLQCFGLGTSIIKISMLLVRTMWRLQAVVSDIDTFGCNKWFERDQTRNCSTMFGDCYFPALVKTSLTNFTGCNDISWFPGKYGRQGMFASHISWMLGDHLEQHEEQPCIALHIRRGDACINADRKCFDYDTYYRAVKVFTNQDPSLQRIVVLTDAHDFPLEQFQSLVSEVTYSQEVNRSKYLVDHLKNESIEVWTPENRELGNAASELLNEVSEAQKCAVLVGTTTAGISKWLINTMITRQGRVPLFYSLQGCLKNSWDSDDFRDRGCEPPLL